MLDRTELKDKYDFRLDFAPEQPVVPLNTGPSEPNNLPSIFTALQEQLGLKLESSRGPVEVIVVDSVQKPSEN